MGVPAAACDLGLLPLSAPEQLKLCFLNNGPFQHSQQQLRERRE
jgi:hypothetical protein